MLEGLTPPEDTNLCKVSKLAADLSPEDNAILQDALADHRWSTLALTNELNARGLIMGETAVRKHRAGKCKCAR